MTFWRRRLEKRPKTYIEEGTTAGKGFFSERRPQGGGERRIKNVGIPYKDNNRRTGGSTR